MKTPVASVCSLERAQLEERSRRWAELGRLALRSVTRGETNVFEYARSDRSEAVLEELVAAERECCALGGLTWDVAKRADALVLSLTFPAALRGSREAELILAALGSA